MYYREHTHTHARHLSQQPKWPRLGSCPNGLLPIPLNYIPNKMLFSLLRLTKPVFSLYFEPKNYYAPT